MTGYSKELLELADKQITIEIKSLNSKSTDISIRMPQFYREKELDIRKIFAEELKRGKIECYISVDLSDNYSDVVFNEKVINKYITDLSQILDKNNLKFNEEIFRSVLSLPNVYKKEKEDLSDEEWYRLKTAIDNTIEKLKEYRKKEGANLEVQICNELTEIEKMLKQIDKYEKERTKKIKEKLLKHLNDLQGNYDKERLEQEMIYYIERIDFSEEKTRLYSHIAYFRDTIKSSEVVKGKKLTFIAQEIGREINTLGVKSSHEAIQKIVVIMKDHLERIKEQLANIL